MNKTVKKRQKRESYVLARRIHEIENDFQKRFGHDKWKLTEDITLEMSDDKMVWYLWKRFPDQVRWFWKCVPMTYISEKNIAKILSHQDWVCI